jgi:hypothetical protein
MRSFQDALKADENYVPAILGVARIATEENPPAAKQAIERALRSIRTPYRHTCWSRRCCSTTASVTTPATARSAR